LTAVVVLLALLPPVAGGGEPGSGGARSGAAASSTSRAPATAIEPSSVGWSSAALSFATWIEGFRNLALARGVSPATLSTALDGLAPLPQVLALDRDQPEVRLPYDRYLARLVTPSRTSEGRRHLQAQAAVLDDVGVRFGVEPRIIVALWGLESDYGRSMGNFPVIQSLATLAWEGRRRALFQEELVHALQIMDGGHVPAARFRGSWAGAFGQSQFMPSSYTAYAVDHDGDGRPDLWDSLPDVFASIANYLVQAGWQRADLWGEPVRPPSRLDAALVGVDRAPRTVAAWHALGVRQRDGAAVSGVHRMAWLIQPGGATGPSFLVYDNFRVLLTWNRSTKFATAVGTLADRLGAGRAEARSD
jgi:membrane-bound lytic murein transglycosylase B